MFQKKYLAISLAMIMMPVVAPAQEGGQSASGGEQQAAPESSRSTTLQEVTVTGSRLSKSAVESASPVITITSDDIKAGGFTTVKDVLITASQSTGNVDTEMDMVGSTPNGQFVNLRGLGPQYTLVLLNGRRMADYPQAYGFRSTAVSLNSIPVAAIERVEILSGGASAIYGSDAVAGVINIITKSNYNGHELNIRGGTTTRGGGSDSTIQFTGGKSTDRWNATYALQFQRRLPIMAYQRDFMATTYRNPAFRDDPSRAPANLATRLVAVAPDGVETYLWQGADGSLSPSVEALTYACNHTNPNYILYRAAVTDPEVNRCGDVDYSARRTISNGIKQLSGVLTGNYHVSDSTQMYYTVAASKARDEAYNSTMFNYYLPKHVYDPDLGEVYVNRTVTPAEVGGQAAHEYHEKSYNFNVGMRGVFPGGRFDWDANVGYSRFDTSIDRRNFVTQRLNQYFLGDSLGTTDDGLEIHHVNVDRLFSPMSPADYERISSVFTNRGESSIVSAQGTIRGDLFELPAGAVQMATVLEGAREKFLLTPDIRTTPDYTGDRIFNWTAVNAGGARNRYALGTEFHIPILESLNLNAAGRYDRYASGGATTGAFTWQTGLEWRPASSLLLRATHAISFRAPDLTYLYTDHSSNFYSLVDVYQCRLDGLDPSSPDCQSGASKYQNFVEGEYQGNSDLEPEKGKSLTAGFVWDITRNLSVTTDFYRIQLSNAVSEIDPNFLMEQDANCLLGKTVSGEGVDANSPSCRFYTGLVTRNASGDHDITNYSSYPINQAAMRTEGVDATLNYRFHVNAIGDFSTKLGYTLVTKLETQLFPGDAFVNERDSLQYSNFRSKANWQLSWSGGHDWTASVYGYRWGSLPNFAKKGRIGPYIVWNTSVTKKITKNLAFGVLVNNLFDNVHPNDPTYTSYPYFGHSYSPIGRQVYAEITYDF